VLICANGDGALTQVLTGTTIAKDDISFPICDLLTRPGHEHSNFRYTKLREFSFNSFRPVSLGSRLRDRYVSFDISGGTAID
jgi:hypothetical protein